MDVDSIIKKIAEKANKNEGEIREEIKRKVNEFAGLLTELGAAYAVARDYGVDIYLDRVASRRVKVRDLKPGMERVDLVLRVFRIYPPRSFSKGERRGRYCKILAGDKTGNVFITLWHKDVDLVESGKIKQGSAIEIINGYVTEYNGRLDVSVGYDGRIIPDVTQEEDLPPGEEEVKVRDLKEGMENVHIKLTVLRVFERREIEETQMLSFLGGDDTGTIRVVLWGENADIDIKEGDVLEIEGGYTRNGEKISLHVGNGFVRKCDGNVDHTRRKKISDLRAGDRFVEIRAVVTRDYVRTEVQICPTCGKRTEGRCECGAEPKKMKIAAVELSDGSGSIRGVFFGDISEKLPANPVASEFVLSGYVRENKEYERLEFVVKECKDVRWREELERLLAEKGKQGVQ